MKKINRKQQVIMRVVATILFAIAWILTLSLIFDSNNKANEKYVGVWKIGYEFYKGETKENLLYTFEQELHILKDKTFFTKEKYIPGGETNNKVSGTYEVDGNKFTLKYEQNGQNKSNILILKDNKLCLEALCERYYTFEKIDVYIPMFNADIATSEDNNG